MLNNVNIKIFLMNLLKNYFLLKFRVDGKLYAIQMKNNQMIVNTVIVAIT